ncbi:hypothetical protein [Neorhodopirellula pilleata]|uniref:Elp3/MiaA/NifB-like radical SAM core domain-containing protein n=1 Tax=Neorhodopirellula pilleata TaxID=2714738 RepID=A0A5C5ZZB6_9BACT|nr:hypothetical protein [Neorhodopirellula pilleata]TWT92496.1 hypothetical protein Pla100_45140 [Neorhodopirellula pilleata]
MNSTTGAASAYGISVEQEPIGHHKTRHTLTLLLRARRCPFECVFCDLWLHNHASATPVGSIPSQISDAIEQTFSRDPYRGTVPREPRWAIKLYNGGNFTDPLSVPETDWTAIADRCKPFDRVIVENHATMCGSRLLKFQEQLRPRLEVAIGLETANVDVLSRQQKKMTLSDFDRAAKFVLDHGMDLRCFTMLQLPYSDVKCSVDDSIATVQHAVGAGALFVAIIPTRHTTKAMQSLVRSGDHQPPNLRQLERALFESLRWTSEMKSDAVVIADTWDIDHVDHCSACQRHTIANIQAMNAAQRPCAISSCQSCGTEACDR